MRVWRDSDRSGDGAEPAAGGRRKARGRTGPSPRPGAAAPARAASPTRETPPADARRPGGRASEKTGVNARASAVEAPQSAAPFSASGHPPTHAATAGPAQEV